MSKSQWTAASGTIGQPPSGFDNLLTADGQSLSDWQIVANAGASEGQALKLVSSASVRRLLTLQGVGGDVDARIDIRGRIYASTNNANGINVVWRATADDGSCWYTRINSTRKIELRKYNPNTALVATSANAYAGGSLPSWLRFRVTYERTGSPIFRVAVWKDDGSESSPDLEVTSSPPVEPTAIPGSALGLGMYGGTNDLIDWITVGVGEDADVTPSVGGSASIAISPDPASVTIGGTVQATITRSEAAPAGAGVTYNLTSGTPAAATVPATVNMAAGQATATFNVTGVSAGSSVITATNAADSGETDTITVNVVTVRKLKLLAHIDALGATAVKGAVFAAPTSGALVGAKIGEFTGASFGAAAENGKAPLSVDVADFGGEALTTADTPVCVWEGTSAAGSALPGSPAPFGSNGVHECTVIEV